MRVVISLLLLFSISLSGPSGFAAPQLAAQAPQADAQALAILQLSFFAMGGQNLSGIRDASVELLASDPADPASGGTKVTAKMIGTKMWRTDSQTTDGAAAWIFNGAEAQSTFGSEVQPSLSVSVAEAGNWLVPVFSVIGESSAGLKTTYLGLEGSNHHLQILRTSEDPILTEVLSPCDVYVDAKTMLPARLAYFLHPPANLKVRIPVEVTYADWRAVSGLAIPFYVRYSVRGQITTEYRVQAFAVNLGTPESDFTVR